MSRYVCTHCGWAGAASETVDSPFGPGCPKCPYQVLPARTVALLDSLTESSNQDQVIPEKERTE